MAGEWEYRAVDQHSCDKPRNVQNAQNGDIWRCECGKRYQVTDVYQDWRDPYDVTVSWKEMPPTRTGYYGAQDR